MNPAVESAFALGGLGVIRLLGAARVQVQDGDIVGFCSYLVLVAALVALLASFVLLPNMWAKVYTVVMTPYAGGQ